jgi:hypothetical protein
MAVFVDLEDDDVDPPQQNGKPKWAGGGDMSGARATKGHGGAGKAPEEASSHLAVGENPNRNFTTQALGCYP